MKLLSKSFFFFYLKAQFLKHNLKRAISYLGESTDQPLEVWSNFQFGHRSLKIHNIPPQSFKISQCGYSASQTTVDSQKSSHVRFT